MIQYQLKLRLTKRQERQLESWLPTLAAVWNWAVRKIELDARDGIYYSRKRFQNLLADHGSKLDIPSHTLQGALPENPLRAVTFSGSLSTYRAECKSYFNLAESRRDGSLFLPS